MTISSPPLGTLVTDEPVANFLPRSLATYLSSALIQPRCNRYSYLLEVQPESLQPDDGRNELLLVALDPLDGDDAVGQLVGVLLLGGLGLGGLLLGVLGGALLGIDREGCCGGFQCFCARVSSAGEMLDGVRAEERTWRPDLAV